MNLKTILETLAVSAALIGAIVAGLWAMDARHAAKAELEAMKHERLQHKEFWWKLKVDHDLGRPEGHGGN